MFGACRGRTWRCDDLEAVGVLTTFSMARLWLFDGDGSHETEVAICPLLAHYDGADVAGEVFVEVDIPVSVGIRWGPLAACCT